jgi:undecaprenyl-diphosphatase
MEAPDPEAVLPTAEEGQRLMSAALIVGLLVAGAALVLVTWLGREVMEGEALGIDEGLRGTLHSLASPRTTTIMIAASRYGGPVVLVPLALAASLAFQLRGWSRGALLVAITVGGAGLLNWLLKLSFGRARPEAFFDYPVPGSASFPSGHSIFAASIFGGLAALLSPRLTHPALRVAVWCLAIFLTLLVGFSRVYLGVHYPSDVLAGYSIAAIWVTAVAFGDRLARRRRMRST